MLNQTIPSGLRQLWASFREAKICNISDIENYVKPDGDITPLVNAPAPEAGVYRGFVKGRMYLVLTGAGETNPHNVVVYETEDGDLLDELGESAIKGTRIQGVLNVFQKQLAA